MNFQHKIKLFIAQKRGLVAPKGADKVEPKKKVVKKQELDLYDFLDQRKTFLEANFEDNLDEYNLEYEILGELEKIIKKHGEK